MKKLLSVIVALVLLLAMAAPAIAATEIRFMWWGGDARHQATLAAIDKYMELNPDIKISGEYGGYEGYYEKIVTQLAGGTAPDLIQMDTMWYTEMQSQGSLENFFAAINDLGIDYSGFDEAMLKVATHNGRLDALPAGISIEHWFLFNKEFFEKHNIDPKTRFDWDSFMEVGTRVHQEDPNDYLLILTGELLSLAKAYITQITGLSIVSDEYEVNFDAAVAEEMFDYFVQLWDNGVMYPYEDAIVMPNQLECPAVLNGNIGIGLYPSAYIPTVIATVDYEIGQMPLPIRPGTTNTNIEVRPPMLFSINAKGAHTQETAKFLEWFLTSEEAAEILKDFRGVSANANVRAFLDERDLLSPVSVEAIETIKGLEGLPPTDLTFNSELEKIFNDILGEVAYKVVTPKEAASKVVSQLETKLAELKG